MAKQFCLGVPSYANNIVTLTEAQARHAFGAYIAEEMALHHLDRISKWTPHHHIGCLASRFPQQISIPGLVPLPSLPHDPSPPLVIQDTIDSIGKKADTAPVVCRCFVSEMLQTTYVDYLYVYTDGSVDRVR